MTPHYLPFQESISTLSRIQETRTVRYCILGGEGPQGDLKS
jgi:hypothetical protein